MKPVAQLSRMALAVGMLASGAAAVAQQGAAAEPQADIIVTGTRTTGMQAADSPAPIQMLGSDLLARSAQPDLSLTLAQNLPSVQAQSFGTDLQQVNLTFRLRGLSPNHTLVLLNGKRRHGTANVSVAGGVYGGAAAPDISFVSSASIDHVEVLQDGAAAQYGTDAIAGVINIIQKKADHGGSFSIDGGQYFDQYDDGNCPSTPADRCMAKGGKSWSVVGNIGIAPFEGAYLNLTGERKHRGRSVRTHYDAQYYQTGPDNATARNYLAIYQDLKNNPTYPFLDQRQGDPDMDITNVMYNAGYEFGDFEIYSFGSYGHKNASTLQVFRYPDKTYCTVNTTTCLAGVAGGYYLNAAPVTVGGVTYAAGPASGASIVPGTTRKLFASQGYEPQQVTSETDYAFTGGFRGEIGGTTFDFASTYGRDRYDLSVKNSANTTLYNRSGFTPTSIYIGRLKASQWSNTLDLTHELDVGLDNPVTIAAGVEYRHETYGIGAGDPLSYYGSGAESFFGWSPRDASNNSRNNFSQYLDISIKPTDKWLVDGAVRHEHYSDFGNTTVFKLTSRYDFSDAIAIRGTVSTGFRAPTLAEEFYSGINVSTNYLAGIFPANGSVIEGLGFPNLKPEKSTNFSLGLVLHPFDRLSITIDAYMIKLRDRITLSPTFYGYRGAYCPPGQPGQANNPGTVAQTSNPNDVRTLAAGPGGVGRCTNVAAPGTAGDSYYIYNQQTIYNVMTAAVSDIPAAVLYLNSNPADGRNTAGGYLSVQTFANALSVHTKGIDFQANYSSNFGSARVNWNLSMNYNKNKIKKVNPLPAGFYTSTLQPNLTTLYPTDVGFDSYPGEHDSPRFRATAGANLTWGKFAAGVRENYYGSTWTSATQSNGAILDNGNIVGGTGPGHVAPTIYKQYIKSAFITDIDISYQLTQFLRLTVGANNVFNHYSNAVSWQFNQEPKERLGNGGTAAMPYQTGSPYGYNGGYYYARASVKF
ncbi:TonB-dependent receptor plug domain-containing protein [Sphingomonas quercus]|uniref:TonB-dependent receptor n=1 Tax=Sphingomonas quercus TaxID=2842451 RepID=A0ABS6BLA6_9SPHN|nr:TonB-dependent receptor [Sphingomonas quercus]MBU3078551.1 TonB-dependent receptor [Sphingomonas quercus]